MKRWDVTNIERSESLSWHLDRSSPSVLHETKDPEVTRRYVGAVWQMKYSPKPESFNFLRRTFWIMRPGVVHMDDHHFQLLDRTIFLNSSLHLTKPINYHVVRSNNTTFGKNLCHQEASEAEKLWTHRIWSAYPSSQDCRSLSLCTSRLPLRSQ